jgi:hypothetical protein
MDMPQKQEAKKQPIFSWYSRSHLKQRSGRSKIQGDPGDAVELGFRCHLVRAVPGAGKLNYRDNEL